jgi:Flp pilus assembly protein protease CpaA
LCLYNAGVLIRIVILGLLAAIVLSLGLALYHLGSGKGDSKKLLRALTVRIALSLLLFILLMIAWRAGLITPRGLTP